MIKSIIPLPNEYDNDRIKLLKDHKKKLFDEINKTGILESIIDTNKWLKVNSVVILYDKSDVGDDLPYLDKPSSFSTEQKQYKD